LNDDERTLLVDDGLLEKAKQDYSFPYAMIAVAVVPPLLPSPSSNSKAIAQEVAFAHQPDQPQNSCFVHKSKTLYYTLTLMLE